MLSCFYRVKTSINKAIIMTLILIGLLLFCGVHLVPSFAPGLRASWLGKLGEGGYKGSYSLLLVAGIVMIVLGWRSTLPTSVYVSSAELRLPAMALVILAFLLLVVGSRNSRIRQWVRHPQLTGVLLWALAHLMLNGDNRSVLLFCGLALWAFVQIMAISKREGPWIKGAIPGAGAEATTVIITAVVVTAMIFGHPYFAGVPVF
jgi:uncharacterized membrane protein